MLRKISTWSGLVGRADWGGWSALRTFAQYSFSSEFKIIKTDERMIEVAETGPSRTSVAVSMKADCGIFDGRSGACKPFSSKSDVGQGDELFWDIPSELGLVGGRKLRGCENDWRNHCSSRRDCGPSEDSLEEIAWQPTLPQICYLR